VRCPARSVYPENRRKGMLRYKRLGLLDRTEEHGDVAGKFELLPRSRRTPPGGTTLGRSFAADLLQVQRRARAPIQFVIVAGYRSRFPQFLPGAGRQGSVALALQPLAQQLAVAAHRFGLFARPPLRGLLVIAAQLHFSEYPFALHFFLQGAERLVDIIVANEDLHGGSSP
jgi:hypothetical protein